jgi:hypothetical protein
MAVLVAVPCFLFIAMRLNRLADDRKITFWSRLDALNLLKPLTYLPLATLYALELMINELDMAFVTALRIAFAVGVVLPVIINTIALSRWMEAMLKLPDFNNWFAVRTRAATIVLAAAALSSTSVVKFFGSRFPGLEITTAPLRKDALAALDRWTLVSLLVGDVPRLAVQVIVRASGRLSGYSVALFLAASVVSLWITALSALFFGMVRKYKPKYFTHDEGKGQTLPGDVQLAVRQVRPPPRARLLAPLPAERAISETVYVPTHS